MQPVMISASSNKILFVLFQVKTNQVIQFRDEVFLFSSEARN